MGRNKTETAFSFHCMICFEEFDNTSSRYPVVLPCGHTYVCNTCADRLEKCMECRTSLYMTFNPAEFNNNNNNNSNSNNPNGTTTLALSSNNHNNINRTSTWTSARAGGSTRHGPPQQYAQQPPPKKPQPLFKKRLPLPKNVVLLSLIEATELASADAEKELIAASAEAVANTNNNNNNTGNNNAVATGDDSHSNYPLSSSEENNEEIKISLATALSVGVAGTYAVAAREGLEIFPSRPSQYQQQHQHAQQHAHDVSLTDEDVDTLVQFFHMDHNNNNKSANANNDSGSHSESGASTCANAGAAGVGGGTDTAADTAADTTDGPTKSFEKAHLSFADRVQIVSVEDGWAKLARGYGYVRAAADSNNNNTNQQQQQQQLVKVGSPVDRACKLEAMLRTLSYTRKELRLQQSQVDNEFIRLMNDLQVSLQNDEDLTVICGTAFLSDNSINSSSNHSEHSSTTLPTNAATMVEEKKEAGGTTPRRHNNAASATSAAGFDDDDDDGVVTESSQQYYPQKPQALGPMAVSDIESIRTGIMCFAPSVLGVTTSTSGDSGGGGAGASSSATNNPNHHSQLSTATPFSLSEMASSGRQLLRSTDAGAALFPAVSHPSPSEMRAGAQAWRERQRANAGAGVTGSIDFRTGLSGHMALLSSHAHTHELLDPDSSNTRVLRGANYAHHPSSQRTPVKSSTRLKMSSHTGLTSSKPFNLKALFQAWNSPSRSHTTAGGAGHHQTLKHAGSM